MAVSTPGPSTTEQPRPTALVRALARAHAALVADRSVLDGLNVFPVADADTGTNLVATIAPVAAAAAEASDAGASRAELAERLARTAVRNGRGNSGLILGAWLAGFAEGWGGADVLGSAAARARAAVADPTEGTMLSVAEAAAGARCGDVEPWLAARHAAVAALLATPTQLPVLAERGVVDAGGRGLLHVLDALAVEHGAAPLRDLPGRIDGEAGPAVSSSAPTVAAVVGYEVRAAVAADGTDPAVVARLRLGLVEVGTDVVVAGDGAAVSVHAHGEPGPIVAVVVAHGSLLDLHIEALVEHG